MIEEIGTEIGRETGTEIRRERGRKTGNEGGLAADLGTILSASKSENMSN